LCANCAIDIHDAVCFDLPDHVEARIEDDPQSINRLIDQWQLARATPLHFAARLGRERAAALLLARGARPSVLAGDGRTALDHAEERGHDAVAALLRQHGGVRASQL
jgi:ankyrin repeat protein